MGYEVMDAGGTSQTAVPGGSVPPGEVVELGPDVGATVPAAAPSPAWGRALARARSVRSSVLLAVAVALVVGALAGGFVTGQRNAASAAQDGQRSRLSVVAQIEASSASRENATVRIDVTARVRNLGPESVELVSSPQAVLSDRSGELMAEQTGGGERLLPGADASVHLRLVQPCGAPARRGLSVRVRTADGRTHEVPLRSAGSDGSVGMLCDDGTTPAPPVQARLEGTTARPVLVVTNPRPEAVRVSFASVVSSGSPAVDGLVTVFTEPAMPRLIRAGEQGRVTLDVRATRCVKDIATISQLTQISFPSLVVVGANGLVLQEESGTEDIGGSVDISLLVNQALARACR